MSNNLSDVNSVSPKIYHKMGYVPLPAQEK